MQHHVTIENIEEMRKRQGIEDVELWKAIRGLRVGDFVRLTFLAGTPQPPAAETMRVRITSIREDDFRGKLADQPVSGRLAELRCGSLVLFAAHHIHSLAKGQVTHE